MRNKAIFYTLIFLLCAVIAIIVYYPFSNTSDQIPSNVSSERLYLRAYENTVALYDGEKIKDIYSDIVLNALPVKDQNSLNSGIPIENVEQLNSLLEDFDG